MSDINPDIFVKIDQLSKQISNTKDVQKTQKAELDLLTNQLRNHMIQQGKMWYSVNDQAQPPYYALCRKTSTGSLKEDDYIRIFEDFIYQLSQGGAYSKQALMDRINESKKLAAERSITLNLLKQKPRESFQQLQTWLQTGQE